MAVRSSGSRRWKLPIGPISLAISLAALGLALACAIPIGRDILIQPVLSGPMIPTTGARSGLPAGGIQILVGTTIAFGVGMVSLVAGLNSLPGQMQPERALRQAWLSGLSIGFSLIALLLDVVLLYALRLALRMPWSGGNYFLFG